MPNLLIAGPIHPAGFTALEGSGIGYDYVEDTGDAYARFVERADALVIRTQPLSAAILARAPRLKIVSRHGVGVDAVDLAALAVRRIPLCVVGDVNSLSVAEHAMTLILACAKRVTEADRAVRERRWHWRHDFASDELAGRRLLILGYGRSGRRLARMAQAFGMEVEAYAPTVAARGWPDDAATPAASLPTALAEADVVSIHAPYAGRPLLGRAEFAALKPGAILINTARGGVVDEAALAEALAAGRVASAGLDVFEAEPPPPDHPLLGFPQVVVTPHIAGLTQAAARRMAVASIRNVVDFFAGRLDPALVVNRDLLA